VRVMIVPYSANFHLVGGHVTQQVETERALRRLGVEVEIGSTEEAVRADVDVVHAFEDIRPLLALGKPRGRLVVSPIYFPKNVLLGPVLRQGGQPHMLEARMRHAARVVRHARERHGRARELRSVWEAWRHADRIVVNSTAEGKLLRRDARGLHELRVAHSGVAGEAFDGDPAEGRRLLGIGKDPFVLSVARVEPVKNQVSLALAVRGLPLRLVLVGAVLPGNEHFLASVREALPDVVHIPYIEHSLLPHVHAASSVHALPSWYETTGLSTLEALAVGRPVVVAGGPCVKEYFTGCARFCYGGSIRSIRRAVLRALDGPIGCERDRARQFSWDRTARELLTVYTELANGV
jgi:glycosyltransferase involved in cell wall biosynthesis